MSRGGTTQYFGLDDSDDEEDPSLAVQAVQPSSSSTNAAQRPTETAQEQAKSTTSVPSVIKQTRAVTDMLSRLDRLVERGNSEEEASSQSSSNSLQSVAQEEGTCETYEEYVDALAKLLASYSAVVSSRRGKEEATGGASAVRRAQRAVLDCLAQHKFYGIPSAFRGPLYLVCIFMDGDLPQNMQSRYRETIDEAVQRAGGSAFTFSHTQNAETEVSSSSDDQAERSGKEGGAVLDVVVSFYFDCFCVKDAPRQKFLKSIATHLFSQLVASDVARKGETRSRPSLYPLAADLCSDSEYLRMISVLLHHAIARFAPSQLLASSGTCMEWRGLVQYWTPTIYRQIFSRLSSSAPFAPLASFFTSCGGDEALVNAIWDRLLLAGDMGLPYFFALSLILDKHDQLLAMQKDLDGEGGWRVVECDSAEEHLWLHRLDKTLAIANIDHVHILFQRAERLQEGTPLSIVGHLLAADAPSRQADTLLESERKQGEAPTPVFYPGTICMYVTVAEVCSDVFFRAQDGEEKDEEGSLGFLVVDCRPSGQFAAGHLPTAINLDFEWASSHPAEYSSRFTALEAHRGKKKVVLVGTGDEAGDRDILVPALLQLIQRDFPFLSCLAGGYRGCHRAADAHKLPLSRHDPLKCLVCTPDQSSSLTNNMSLLGGRLASMLKQTGTAVAAQVNHMMQEVEQEAAKIQPTTAPVIYPLPERSNVSSAHLQEWLSSGKYKVFTNRRVVPSSDSGKEEVLEIVGYLMVTPMFLVWLRKSPPLPGKPESKSIRCCFAQKYLLSSMQRISFSKALANYVNFDFFTQDAYAPKERIRFYLPDPRLCIAAVQAGVAAAVQKRKELMDAEAAGRKEPPAPSPASPPPEAEEPEQIEVDDEETAASRSPAAQAT